MLVKFLDEIITKRLSIYIYITNFRNNNQKRYIINLSQTKTLLLFYPDYDHNIKYTHGIANDYDYYSIMCVVYKQKQNVLFSAIDLYRCR